MDSHAGSESGSESDLRARAAELLTRHWLDEGYTMPNRDTYPWQWLWDSCFHSIVWAELGDDRALRELEQLFVFQTETGFVPHMNYHPNPAAAVEFWSRRGASTITQPPMYGYAAAELARRGMSPGDELLDRAEQGLRFLFERRRRSDDGLIELVHPWESGCDDSARWDSALDGRWDREAWRAHKHALLGDVLTDSTGGAIANDRFGVASVGFNALVAFNAIELNSLIDSTWLGEAGSELSAVVSSRWDDDLRTWTDAGAFSGRSGRARTTDAFFALLVDDDLSHSDAAVAELLDDHAYGGACGPAGTHRAEPTYDPLTYWRGPAWPQMSYLLWVALQRSGRRDDAAVIAASTRRGAERSGFAEYWHPDTGQSLGAIPQSWATVVLLMTDHQK